MWRRGLFLILTIVSVVCALIYPVMGKEYPTKPIEIICQYTAGSISDIHSRIVGDIAKKYLNQPLGTELLFKRLLFYSPVQKTFGFCSGAPFHKGKSI